MYAGASTQDNEMTPPGAHSFAPCTTSSLVSADPYLTKHIHRDRQTSCRSHCVRTQLDEPPLWPCRAMAPRLPRPLCPPKPHRDGERKSPRMSHSFKLSRRIARFRAPLRAAMVLTLLGCDSTDSLNPRQQQSGTARPRPDDSRSTERRRRRSADRVARRPQLRRRHSRSACSAQPTDDVRQPLQRRPAEHRSPVPRSRAQRPSRRAAARSSLMLAGTAVHYKDGSGHFSLDQVEGPDRPVQATSTSTPTSTTARSSATT